MYKKYRTAITALTFAMLMTLICTNSCFAAVKPETLPYEISISAKNAVVIEASTGKVLYEKNGRNTAYPASTTKIMTALLAIESGDLDQKLKIPSSAVGIEGSSIYLAEGEVLSMRDLVYGLMLRSGNDAAIAISSLVDASVDAFVEKMNKRANEIGAEDTNFENPNGLFSENHYTTAYDMAIIAGEAMKNSEFREVAGAKSWVADRGEGKFNHFYNKNKVIFDYSGGTGIKIGYTKRSGRTLVASAIRQGMEVICAVMDAPDWFNDSYKLMDHAFSCFEIDEVFKGGQRLMALPINNGDKGHVFVGTKDIISLPVSKNAETNLEIVYQLEKNPILPIRRFQKAGTLELYEDGIQVVKHDIYYLEDIDELKSEPANIHLNRIRRIFL